MNKSNWKAGNEKVSFNIENNIQGGEAVNDVNADCQDAVLAQLLELSHSAPANSLALDPEAHFNDQQNAHVVRNAEQYYRTMFGSKRSS